MSKLLENRENKQYLFSNYELKKLIFPLIIEQLLSILVGVADSIMVSTVGEAAVSAVSLVDSINLLLFFMFSAVATGGTVVAAQYLGSKNKEEACRSCDQLLCLTILISIIITAIMYLLKDLILNNLFGSIEADVKNYSYVYLMIVFASIPFMALYNFGAAMFRAMGNTKISMKISILMNAINVCGNAFLIYGFKMGVEGVAIPTLVSRIVASVAVIKLLSNKSLDVHIDKKYIFKFDFDMTKRILKIGIPNGIENSLFQLGKIILISFISTLGTSSVAANAVGNAISVFQIMPGLAMGHAIVTVVSHCIGANDYGQAKYYTKKLILTTHFMHLVLNLVVFAILPLIMSAYKLTAQTSKLAEQILIFHGIFAILIWPLSFTLPNTLRAANDAKFTMIVSVTSMWIFRIGFGIILGRYFSLGVFGVWVAMIIDWCVRLVFFVNRYRKGKWTKMKLI